MVPYLEIGRCTDRVSVHNNVPSSLEIGVLEYLGSRIRNSRSQTRVRERPESGILAKRESYEPCPSRRRAELVRIGYS